MIFKLLLFVISCSSCVESIEFDKVVIWGHKLGSHTHSYIHNGFYIAFQHLGYPTFWYDDNDDVSQFDFSNSLFITEGQVDGNIPLRNDCYYLLHNIQNLDKYSEHISARNRIFFQVYTHDVLKIPHRVQIEPFIYYDLPAQCLYMPWATDLLPDEIEEIKQTVTLDSNQKRVYWIGTIGDGIFGNKEQLDPFIQACQENNLEFIGCVNVSHQDHKYLIGSSYIAPTIVGKWQFENGYIPCRIFKNISYGKLGITNSKSAYELFDQKIVYNPDTYQLFFDAKERLKTISLTEIYELIDKVKENHTYINRIQSLLFFLELNESYCDQIDYEIR